MKIIKIAKCSCFLMGIVLLLTALSLILYNISEDKNSARQAQNILTEIKTEIPETTEETQEKQYNLFSEYETETTPEEPTIEIDNQTYIGVIRIAELGIELPVMSEWSYPNLKIAPCRYQGKAFDKNMIIIAHNYRSHFGGISDLNPGSEIIFIDATGKCYTYEVDNIENISGTDIESMELGSAEYWDLTLFTCTLSGQSRVTVRAILKDEN